MSEEKNGFVNSICFEEIVENQGYVSRSFYTESKYCIELRVDIFANCGVYLKLLRGQHDSKIAFPCVKKFDITLLPKDDIHTDMKALRKTKRVDYSLCDASVNGRTSTGTMGFSNFVSTELLRRYMLQSGDAGVKSLRFEVREVSQSRLEREAMDKKNRPKAALNEGLAQDTVNIKFNDYKTNRLLAEGRYI